MAESKKRKSLLESFLEPGGLMSEYEDGFEASFDLGDGTSITISGGVVGGSSRVDTSDWPDERVAVCPSCDGPLKKVPAAKTKCPICGEFMYVRTDPRTKSRRVLPFKELEEVEDAWAKLQGYWDERQEGKLLRQRAMDSLSERLGRPATDDELDLSILSEQREDALLYRQMGIVRNTYLQSAQILLRQGEHRKAALDFMTVALLDGNGAGNAVESYEIDARGDERRSFTGKWFSRKDVMYLPYVANQISRCVKLGLLLQEDLVQEFDSLGRAEELGCPLEFKKVWLEFKQKTA